MTADKPFQPLEILMPIAGPAVEAILSLFRAQATVVVACSFGKDSSCVMVLAIEAALRAKVQGLSPRLLCLTGDTRIENPEIEAHAKREQSKLKALALANGLDLTIHVAMPSLSDSFQMTVLSGRSLPSFAGMAAQCSQNFKINPMIRLRKQIMAAEVFGALVVTLTGTRFAESERRSAKMKARGDSATEPVRNKDGDLMMTPVAHWETDDVWELLGYCNSGLVDTYSDQSETLRIYAAAGGTTCAVVSDMISDERKQSGGCGARTGCSLCVQVGNDKSMEAMLREPRYEYMAGLNALRNYLAATQFDFSRRNWIGRTIEGGRIQVGPSQYSPAELLALTRYCMTIDAIEQDAARSEGIEPRFELLPFTQMVALDVMWSLNATLPAFQAVREWQEIRNGSKRYPVPTVVAMPRRPVPALRFLEVDPAWESCPDLLHAGLSEPLADLAAELGGGESCMGHTTTSAGLRVLDINTGPELEIDLESADHAVYEEYEWLKAKHQASLAGSSWTSGYRWWVQRGAVSVAAAVRGRHDHALRRAVFKERRGLAGANVDLQVVLARSTSGSVNREFDLLAAAA